MTELESFDDIKARHDILRVAETLGVEIKSKAGSSYKALCPFHADHNPSFLINPVAQKCKCMSPGCNWNTQTSGWGDIFDLVKAMLGIGMKEAVEWLDGKKVETKPRKVYRRQESKPFPDQEVFEWEVRKSLRYQSDAIRHWSGRCIPAEAVRMFKIGAIKQYAPRSPYLLSNGEKVFRLPAMRYTIPWYTVDGRLAAINMRLDASSAQDAITMADPSLIERVRHDMAKSRDISPSSVTDRDLYNILFGDKYLFFPGSKPRGRIYNAQEIAECRGGEFIQKQLPVVFITEGEINTHTATANLGIPCIAVKSSAMDVLKVAFKNIETIVIFQDNDSKKFRSDGSAFFPGKEQADKIIERSGRIEGENIFRFVAPDGYNDINDLAQPGELAKWFEAQTRAIGLKVTRRHTA